MHERTEARKDLAAFLLNRRSRITPVEVGLEPGARRRTRGLRREELSQLAGISLSWYTWLEQGRDVAVSRRTLDGLARALRLDATERDHLFALAQQPLAEDPPRQAPLSSHVQHVLDVIRAPAYVIDRKWDVLAWNRHAERLFGDFGAVPAHRRNLVWLVFVDSRFQRLFVNWEQDAPRVLAKFRTSYVRSGGKRDAAYRQLIEELRSASPYFRDWWDRQDVLGLAEGAKTFRLNGGGAVEMEHTSFSVGSDPDLRLVIYTRAEGGAASRVRAPSDAASPDPAPSRQQAG